MANVERIAPLLVKDVYFNGDGTPTAAGEMLINSLNLLVNRTGGVHGALGVALKSYAKANLPTTNEAGHLIYVTDDAGGEVPAFSDSAGAWRRVTDRAVIS